MRSNFDDLWRRVWARAHRAPWLLAAYRGCVPARVRAVLAARAARRRFARITFSRNGQWRRQHPLAPPASPPPAIALHDAGYGVNVLTYAYGQFGLAESARLYCRALLTAGWQIAVHDAGLKIPHAFNDRTLKPYMTERAPFPVNLVFVNPDHFDEAIQSAVRRHVWRDRYTIACWFWELEEFPATWLPALDHADEIIVASEFVACALRKITSKRVTVIPIPLHDAPCSGRTRADFGLGDEFVFLATFDFNSSSARKNPLAVVEAFIRAFPDPDVRVQLLVKSSNGYRHPIELQNLLDAASRDARIRVRDEVLDIEDFNALVACIDAYVSLHRSEGFGLAIAQAMQVGKPVVATAYSGNMDFMDEQAAYLVDYERIPVRPGQYIHWEGQHWADPNVSDAAGKMRRLYVESEERRQVAAAAKRRIRDVCSPQIVAGALTQLLLSSGRFRSQQSATRPGLEVQQQ